MLNPTSTTGYEGYGAKGLKTKSSMSGTEDYGNYPNSPPKEEDHTTAGAMSLDELVNDKMKSMAQAQLRMKALRMKVKGHYNALL